MQMPTPRRSGPGTFAQTPRLSSAALRGASVAAGAMSVLISVGVALWLFS